MTDPAIYVGTYRRYNEGSLHGAWLQLEDYSDISEFWEAVNELHKAEIAAHGEIEPMFQDWEGIPSRFISESHLDPDVWEKWVELDEDDRELLEVYLDNVNQQGDIDEAREAFSGTHRSSTEWAEQFLDDSGMLAEVPTWAQNYIDYAAYANDAERGGDMNFVEHEGQTWVFHNR